MNAEKSESCWLSRRNISVAGSADHSVIAFILIDCACSSLSKLASNVSHGISVCMHQRACSSSLKSLGYSMAVLQLVLIKWARIGHLPEFRYAFDRYLLL